MWRRNLYEYGNIGEMTHFTLSTFFIHCPACNNLSANIVNETLNCGVGGRKTKQEEMLCLIRSCRVVQWYMQIAMLLVVIKSTLDSISHRLYFLANIIIIINHDPFQCYGFNILRFKELFINSKLYPLTYKETTVQSTMYHS